MAFQIKTRRTLPYAHLNSPTIIQMKAQATIWIILALFLLAALILFLFLKGDQTDEFIPTPSGEFSVESYLSACVEKEVNRATSIMLPQGGFIAPNSFALYNKTDIEFLCLTSSYFEPCINQHPVFIGEMEKEILHYISPGVDACFDDLKMYVERKGGTFEIDSGESQIDVELNYDYVFVTVHRNAVLHYKEKTTSFDNFVIDIYNPAYNLGIVAIEIANQEARYCYFETAGYSLSQPRYSVQRTILSDQTKIYSIEDTQSHDVMRIAVRSCALPEGMPG